jgi:hypothetical protein
LQSSKWAYIFVIYIALERAKMATSYAGTHKHVREREREMLVWKEKTREERSLFMRGRACKREREMLVWKEKQERRGAFS